MGDMDSGNSGSMQSSSTGGGGGGGDDQEYESRGESSFPSFFNPPNFPVNPFDNARLLQLYSLNNGSSSGGMFDHHHQQQQQQQQQGQVFDSLETANFLAQNNSASNMEMVWANRFGCLRSAQSDEATCTPTTTATAPGYNSNSNPMSTPQVQLGGHAPPLHNLQGPTAGVPSAENSPRSSTQNPNPNPNQNQNVNLGGVGSGGGPGRNPKKRSRASRRAPTTVLTTDTTNFRQMVQEFTGIPAPPFSAAGFSTRTRLDLFGGMGMGMGMGMSMGMGLGTGMGMGILPRTGGAGGSTNLEQPSYLLRPFAQKVLPHPSPSPLHSQQQQQRNTSTSTSNSAGALAEATVAASSASATASTPGNTIISSSTSDAANGATISPTFNLSPQNVLQPPNPMFAFQSLLQPSPNSPASDKYPLSLIQQDAGMDNLGSKAAGSGSSGTAATAQGSGAGGEGGPQSWAGLHQGLGLTQGGHDHHHLPPHRTTGGSVNEGVGNFMSSGTDHTSNSQRGAPMNGTSDNHGGVVRGERGMVDSWICSSD